MKKENLQHYSEIKRILLAAALFSFGCFFLFPFDAAAELVVKKGERIQEAIDKAVLNEIIVIEPGIYRERLVISKPVTLKGSEGTVLDGEGAGNVVEITADHVTIEGIEIVRSGRRKNEAGITISSSSNRIINNTMKEIHYGIYVNEGSDNQLINNRITGNDAHFSQRGNGVHLFKGERNILRNNKIDNVQDGIYFDFAKDTTVTKNKITNSRYAYHFMFADGGEVTDNLAENNITGLMIMGAKNLIFTGNTLTYHLNYRGYGVLVFDSEQIQLLHNEITYNSNGISLQDARSCTIKSNTIAGNHIGVHLKDDNEDNIVTRNNFIGNVVQTKIVEQQEPLDYREIGNYWDDYRGLDLNSDRIGEIPYESGTMYDQLVFQYPDLHFFFESPAIKVWSSVEKLLPALSSEKGIDRYPHTAPFEIERKQSSANHQQAQLWKIMIMGAGLIVCGGAIIFGGMKR